MLQIPLLVIAVILVWSIILALHRGEAAGILRKAEPAGYWSMVSIGIAAAFGLVIAAIAE